LEYVELKTYPRQIAAYEVSGDKKKIISVYALIKRDPAGLEAITKALTCSDVNALSFNLQDRGNSEGWVISAFLDMAQSIQGVAALETFLKRLTCVEKLVISEPRPVVYQTLLFPIVSGGERVILQATQRFQYIRSQMERILTPAGASVISYNNGLENGRALHKIFMDREVQTGPMHLRDRLELLREHLIATGYGIMDFKNLDLSTRGGLIQLYEGFETEGVKKDRPVCNQMRGLIVGFLQEEWKNEQVTVVEIKCKALGERNCEFAVGIKSNGM